MESHVTVKTNMHYIYFQNLSSANEFQYIYLHIRKKLKDKNFPDEDEEQEIEIGFPTDVKHLAHIGCEDEKTNKPSWVKCSFFFFLLQ